MPVTEKKKRSLSLRDPSGCLFEVDGKLIRQIQPSYAEELEATFRSSEIRTLIEKRSFIPFHYLAETHELNYAFPEKSILVEHERVFFPSYAQEWAPEMLRAAGLLTLEISEKLLLEGRGLKDASPYNILFAGPNPIFIDLLSIEKRNPEDSLWFPYSQFVRTFINPLLAYAYFGSTLQKTFTSSREGIRPAELYSHCSLLQRFRSPFLNLATLPVFFDRMKDKKRNQVLPSQQNRQPELAKYLLQSLFKKLRKTLVSIPLSKPSTRAQFSEYMGTDLPYTQEQFQAKEKFVLAQLEECRPKTVLDAGTNNGHFAYLAESLGCTVLAFDSNPDLMSQLWLKAHSQKLNILALHINLANPTPSAGWRHQESDAFLNRVNGKFECVFFLALIHHLLTTESIPLKEIVLLLKDLVSKYLIIEWINPTDPMFLSLSLGRDFSHLTAQVFEKEMALHFKQLRQLNLPDSNRVLYLFER